MKNRIVALILDRILAHQDDLKDFSERSSCWIYDWCSDFIRYEDEPELEEYLKENTKYIRDYSAFDKLSSDFIWEIREAIEKALEARGFETSEYGYWHKGKTPLIAMWEGKIKSDFRGTVMSCSGDTCCYRTGESFLEDWSSEGCSYDIAQPSSPYEAFELFSECEGCFETEWCYVISNLREEMSGLDLTEYEDIDEVLNRVEIGLCFEEFPLDYREQVVEMFEEMKEEARCEEEYEEECE